MRNKNVSTAENTFLHLFATCKNYFGSRPLRKGIEKEKNPLHFYCEENEDRQGEKENEEKILFFFFPADGEKRFASHLGMQRKPPSGLLFFFQR